MSAREIRRGELYWWGGAPPEGGSGISHPHLVVSEDVFNGSRVESVIVCAITSNVRRAEEEPGNVRLEPGEGGLERPSVIVVSQIAAVRKDQLGDYIGSLSAERVDAAIAGLRFQQTAFGR